MTYRGHVKNGVVVLEGEIGLAEGTTVQVRPVASPRSPRRGRSARTLGQRLLKFAGRAKGLPKDMARHHDHYIRGSQKK